MKFLLIFFLLTSVCWAGEITVDNQKYTVDDKYSWKDFTGRTLTDAKDLNGKVIFGSCFSQEIPDTRVFPDDMKGVTFIGGNLDNVYMPAGNTVIGSTQRKFKVQNDRSDWIVDKDNKPIKPIDEEQYIKLGISIDPKNLPKEMMTESIIEKKQKELNETKIITP